MFTPDRISIIFYFFVLTFYEIKSLEFFKGSNKQFPCRLEWKEYCPGNPETRILGSPLYVNNPCDF